jgi:hypothetical protein
MSNATFRKPFGKWLKRIWSKNRKPWEGDFDGVEALRSAMWTSVFELSDKKRYAYTVAEVAAAARIIRIESENHGAAERGFITPYDRDRVELGIDKLYHEWMTRKTPPNL